MKGEEKSKKKGKFEIRDRRRRKETILFKHSQAEVHTCDVVSVFCCFELDSRGSNLVSV